MAVNWNLRRYTKEQLIEATSVATSYADVARRLGLDDKASPYKSVKPAIEDLGLDTSHFRGKGWNVGGVVKNPRTRDISEYLVKDGPRIGSSALKTKLIKAGILEEKCYAPHCPVPNPSRHPFTGEPVALKLSLDHINGENNDNRLENLRLLCYHCHGLTETWCRGAAPLNPPTMFKCVECFKPIRKDQYVHAECRRCIVCQEFSGGRKNYCRSCGANRRKALGGSKIKYPPVDELIQMLKDTNYTQVGKKLGVSDNAVRKYIRNRGIDPKTLTPIKQDATL